MRVAFVFVPPAECAVLCKFSLKGELASPMSVHLLKRDITSAFWDAVWSHSARNKSDYSAHPGCHVISVSPFDILFWPPNLSKTRIESKWNRI
jgi:hypothetical protein